MKKGNSSDFFTLFSVVLVLCLLGLYGILTLHAGRISNILKENINLLVEMQSNVSKDQVENILAEVRDLDEVKSESVQYIPKTDALVQMNEELGDSYLLNEQDNPFSDIIIFNVTYENVSSESLKNVKTKVEQIPGVQALTYYESVYEYLGTNVRRISSLLLIVGLILGFFAFSLIYSTVQISLYSERFKIRTMELVGASWNQIRKPFIVKSLKLAIKSSGISILLLSLILLLFGIQFGKFWSIISIQYLLLVFLLMCLFSFFITQIASYIVVNRYLGAEKSKFY